MENEYCVWCGKKLTPDTRAKSGDPERNKACKYCENMRDWMLRCIRYGGRVAKYAAVTEEREAPKRERRAAELAANREQEKLSTATEPPARAAMTPEDIAKVVAAVMNELLK